MAVNLPPKVPLTAPTIYPQQGAPCIWRQTRLMSPRAFTNGDFCGSPAQPRVLNKGSCIDFPLVLLEQEGRAHMIMCFDDPFSTFGSVGPPGLSDRLSGSVERRNLEHWDPFGCGSGT